MNNQNHISWIDSIQTRMSVVLILLTTIIVTGFALYNVMQSRSQIQAELNALASNASKRLAGQLASPLWSIDEEQIYSHIDSEMVQKEITAIVIRDVEEDSIMFSRHTTSATMFSVEKYSEDTHIKESRTISNSQGENLGILDIYVSRKFMQRELYDSVINIVIGMLILNLAIFLAVYYTMRRGLIRPIQALTEVAEKISRGDLDTEINTDSRDEIGLLARSIDRLQASQKLAMRQLDRS